MKKGQKVWYTNNTWNTLEEGILTDTKNQSGRDEHPTLYVKGKYGVERILEDWVFGTKNKGKAGLRKKVRRDIQRKKEEIKRLERIANE
jgi:hypothetical protein